jgi:hypothetical protein
LGALSSSLVIGYNRISLCTSPRSWVYKLFSKLMIIYFSRRKIRYEKDAKFDTDKLTKNESKSKVLFARVFFSFFCHMNVFDTFSAI